MKFFFEGVCFNLKKLICYYKSSVTVCAEFIKVCILIVFHEHIVFVAATKFKKLFWSNERVCVNSKQSIKNQLLSNNPRWYLIFLLKLRLKCLIFLLKIQQSKCHLYFSEFRGGGSFQRGYAGGSFRGRRGLPNLKVRTMLIVWMLLLVLFSKIKSWLWDYIIFRKVLSRI